AAIVAYNQRGEPNCAGRGTPEQENCNDDELFWEGNFQELSGIDGKFDDYTTGISGYEIKRTVLETGQNPLTTSNFSFNESEENQEPSEYYCDEICTRSPCRPGNSGNFNSDAQGCRDCSSCDGWGESSFPNKNNDKEEENEGNGNGNGKK
ncbi:MAG: hypothetical protein RI556_13305, partial [Hydrogenovibrio sp.]|uniref:hypothetical protein n=1 Tax=Hydrogenovibrio sp. TaxID=2065821 RepID=UPI00287060E5